MPTENPRAEEAFALYASLDPKERKYAVVAEKLGVSLASVKLWASKGKWRKRLADRETRVARRTTDRLESTDVSGRVRQVKLVELAIMKLIKSISEDAIRGSYGDLERLLRLQAFLQGTDKSIPVDQVRRLFEEVLQIILRETDDVEQRQRMEHAIRDTLDLASGPRRLGPGRTG